MRPLFLHGVGHFHPENVIDNQFLETLDIATTDEWILDRVGIRARRTVLPLDYLKSTRNRDLKAGQEAALYNNVETGRRAALHALDRAGLKPSDIGMVIAGGCTPEMQIPSEACRIAAALGIEAPALDINSACSSFGAQLHLLGAMNPLPRFVLVVNPENTTRVVSCADRATAVLWGDGSSAAVVSGEIPARARIVETTLASNPAGADTVVVPRFGHFFQEGSQVQRFAIKTTRRLEACAGHARGSRTGGRVIGHQANLLVLEGGRRAGIGDEQWHNVIHGNTGAGPSLLSQH